MPFTPSYTYANIVSHVQSLVKGIPVSNISVAAVDQIDAMIWNAYPWRWTRKALTSIALVDGTQDYSYTNTDLWYLLTPRVVNTSVSPTQYRDLRMQRWLEPYASQKLSWPNFSLLCHEKRSDKFRFEAAVSVPSGTTMTLQGEYKFQHPKITATSATIVFPDFYFNVFSEGLLWLLYRFADDARAGAIEIVRGQPIYTGQLGTFMMALDAMKQDEEGPVGDSIYPEESLTGSDSISGTGAFFAG